MKKNMAVADRIARFVIALVLIVLFLTKEYPLPVNGVLLAVSGVFLLTAWAGSCPLYTLLRIDTRQFKH